jgi:hypothetical protein
MYMTAKSIYLDALVSFDEPATVAQIHDRARELFGAQVRGDRSAARLSLQRFVGVGKATKVGDKYYATEDSRDPLAQKDALVRIKQAEIERLLEKIASLESQLERRKVLSSALTGTEAPAA